MNRFEWGVRATRRGWPLVFALVLAAPGFSVGVPPAPALQGGPDPASDTFERASLGGDWTVNFGSVGIVNNSDLGLTAQSGMGLVTWTASTFSADQFCEAVLSPDKAPAMMTMVSARRQTATAAPRYGFAYDDDPGDQKWIIKYDGVPSAQTRILAENAAAPAPQPGDTLRIEVRGMNPPEIKGFLNGVEILSATDNAPDAINSNGKPALAYRLSQGGSTTYPSPAFESWTGGSLAGGNAPPTVTLTNPSTGDTFPEPAAVTIQASASDSDGTVIQVEFLANGTLLDTDTSGPFEFTWAGVTAGFYSLTARATDNNGATTLSSPVGITVTSPGGAGGGLTGEYFDNIDLTGLSFTRTDLAVNFDWGAGSPDSSIGADTFSVRWTGQVEPLYAETYTFTTVSNDGVRLWVNGQLLIDNWMDHTTPSTRQGSIALQAGQKYDLVLEYYENTGDALVSLSWSSPSQPQEVIPPGQLSITDTDGDGMSDTAETASGFDPLSSDQDGNGVADGLDDWDGDGIDNQTELALGTPPGNPPGGSGGGTGGGGGGEGGEGCGATGIEMFLLLGLVFASRGIGSRLVSRSFKRKGASLPGVIIVIAWMALAAGWASPTAHAQTATLPTSQEIADFWDTVFNGPAPYGVPPINLSRTNQRTVSNCTVWDVSFDSYKDPETTQPVRLYGAFAIPNNIPPPGPGGTYPGVVGTHSVGMGPPEGPADERESMAVWFAQKGFAALGFSPRGYGPSQMSVQVDFFTDYLAPDGQMPLNQRFTGWAVDSFQAGEVLAAQPEVWDPNNLTYMGHSGGGFAVLAGAIFSTRFKTVGCSAPAAAWPDAGAWLNYVWGNGSFLSIQSWINSQSDPAYARALVERTLTFISMYNAINNPQLIAKNASWKLSGSSIFFYGGQADQAIPPWDVEACTLLADSSNNNAFHWSPTGGHGGPESWRRAQAWIAGHYTGVTAPAPVAALSVSSINGSTVSFSSAGSQAWQYDWAYGGGQMSSDPYDIVSWEYDFGDGTTQNWGPTVSHTYAGSGTYTVTVTITDGAGRRDTATVQAAVNTGGNGAQLVVSAGNPVVILEGGTSPFQVALSEQPSGNVTVTVARSAGDGDVTVQTGSTLTFTTGNWDAPQIVTLAAAQDADRSSDSAVISVSSPGMTTVNVTAQENDDDATYDIAVGNALGPPGDTVTVPVVLSNLDGGFLNAFSLTLGLDDAVLTGASVGRGAALPGQAWWTLSQTSPAAGVLQIDASEFAQPDPIVVIDGGIVNITFTISPAASPGVYPIVLNAAGATPGTVVTFLSGSVQVQSAGGPDADGDGMPDGFETANGFDPADGDQDGDGIPDGQNDWDGDGVINQSDPTPGSVPGGTTGGGGSGGGGGCGATGFEAILVLGLLAAIRGIKRLTRAARAVGLPAILILSLPVASGLGSDRGAGRDPATDDFERESLGENWIVHNGKVGIVEGDLALQSRGLGLLTWAGSAFPADQFSEAVISAAKDPKNLQQVFVRRRARDKARYGFHWNDRDGGKWEIKLDGVPTAQTRILAGTSTPKGPGPGDTLRLEVQGTRLRAFHNGKQVLTATDTSADAIREAGRPGVALVARTKTLPARIFSRWRGGSLERGE